MPNDEIEIEKVNTPDVPDKNEQKLIIGESVEEMITRSNLKHIEYHFVLKTIIISILLIFLIADLYGLHYFYSKIFDSIFTANNYNCTLLQTLIITSTLACGALTYCIARISLNKSILPLSGNEKD